MSHGRAISRWWIAPLVIALLAAAVAVPACRQGGQAVPVTRPRPVQPYPSYFQSRVGEDLYLFASLAEKIAFHSASSGEVPFDLFISRTGQRVFISSANPALVPRIEVAYEQALGTELAAFHPILTPQTQPATGPAQAESGKPPTRPDATDRRGD